MFEQLLRVFVLIENIEKPWVILKSRRGRSTPPKFIPRLVYFQFKFFSSPLFGSRNYSMQPNFQTFILCSL